MERIVFEIPDDGVLSTARHKPAHSLSQSDISTMCLEKAPPPFDGHVP